MSLAWASPIFEFLPVMAHPFGGSWGYQPLGQFAPHAAVWHAGGFALLIDRCHNARIGILLDWVPAHFPTDAHGLARFDGTPLYEHADPREGYQPDWNTFIFNLGRTEVRCFLIASALYWLERFHADGIRVDAVAAMLYRDYSRKDGEWIPIALAAGKTSKPWLFCRNCADRSTRAVPERSWWPRNPPPGGRDATPDEGGLGFHYKWNMGWMHDTLDYIAQEPIHRRYTTTR